MCSKLCDGTQRSGLRCLTTGVRINLSVDNEDVHILACCDNVVQTTVADIVRSTVATDNPLAALHQIVAQLLQLLADVTAGLHAFGNEGLQRLSCGLAALSVLLVVDPLLCSGLVAFGSLFTGDHFLQQRRDALDGMKAAAGFLRSELSRRLKLRTVPELIFKLDDSLEYGAKIETILNQIRQEQ